MPVSRFASPFPPFSLTLDEKEQLHHVSNEIIAETMDKCEKFLWQDKGRLDPEIWKMVREREGTRVFHNRLPGAGTGNRDMHLLLTLTHLPGSLTDAMYGVLNPSLEQFRIKTAYVEDTLFDMAVLESIVLPTPEAPYESLTLRWGVKRVPLHVRLVAKHTDTVYIETAGMRQLSNGEHVGVHLFHSVTIDKMPPLPQYERFNLSLCAVWRQMAPGKVMMYMTSYFEFKESIKVKMVIMSMADAVLSNSKTMECALLKKLAWLVQNKQTLGHCDATAHEEGCYVCGSQERSARRGLKSACAICSKYTCGRCRIKRTLRMFAPDGQLLAHEMRFCVPCLTSANNLDADAIAREDAGGSKNRSTGKMSSSASVTGSVSSSSVSGDELHFPKRRTNSTASSTKSKTTLSLFA